MIAALLEKEIHDHKQKRVTLDVRLASERAERERLARELEQLHEHERSALVCDPEWVADENPLAALNHRLASTDRRIGAIEAALVELEAATRRAEADLRESVKRERNESLRNVIAAEASPPTHPTRRRFSHCST
jgi:hypothetical protein